VLLDFPIALYYARQNPKLKFIGQRLARGYYAIAFRPEDEPLAAQVDAALQRIADRGRLRQIYEHWGLWDDEQTALFDPQRANEILRQAEGRWGLADICRCCCGICDDSAGRAEHVAAVMLGLPIAMIDDGVAQRSPRCTSNSSAASPCCCRCSS
jgi:polar amino acid transport system substrate-binding protein